MRDDEESKRDPSTSRSAQGQDDGNSNNKERIQKWEESRLRLIRL
jgi:hypothetical protein